METLEQLKEKFNKLNKERGILFKKILELDNDEFCSIIIDENSIKRDWFTVEDIKNWKKITSHQFKDIYLTVMKDIQDPDLEDKKESNWNVVSKSIMNSLNKKE